LSSLNRKTEINQLKIEFEKVSKRKKVNRKTQLRKVQKYFFFFYSGSIFFKILKYLNVDLFIKSEMTP